VGIQISGVGIDTNDLEGAARFWTALTGYTVESRGNDYASLSDASGKGPDLYVQLVPEDRVGKNRLHLDLVTNDRDGEVARALELGATEVKNFVEPDGSGWVVLADTDGNQFCICAE
jgi:predicted enzyme related to lactoylglutathione lyase